MVNDAVSPLNVDCLSCVPVRLSAVPVDWLRKTVGVVHVNAGPAAGAIGGSAAGWAFDVLPTRMPDERIAWLIEADVPRQRDRQILLRNRDDAAGLAMDDRDRAAPVTLARHPSVA